jgi:hypothetical protein
VGGRVNLRRLLVVCEKGRRTTWLTAVTSAEEHFMIYCPRCAAEIGEAIKYCKSCGLPVAQLPAYVADPATPSSASGATGTREGLTPKQRLILTILLFWSVPAFFAGFGGVLGGDEGRFFIALTPATGALRFPGILWAIFRYRSQMKKLRPPAEPPATDHSLAPDAGNQPALSPHTTNPLSATESPRESVIEEETLRLPHERR